MKTDLFDFHLPPELIAQTPAPERTQSKLMVVDRLSGTFRHAWFADLLDLIPPGDLLVLNRSRVIPARLLLPSRGGGKPGEIFFLSDLGSGRFTALVRPGRKFREGARQALPGDREAVVEAVRDDGIRVLMIPGEPDPVAFFRRFGETPLPPYITSRESSADRYQTVFAQEEGSVAAPTAGLHFDDDLLKRVRERGVRVEELVLHVGLGTFKPIEVEEIDSHRMHTESFFVPEPLVRAYAATRAAGGKVWACGSTSVRTLESVVTPDGTLRPGPGETAIYLRPGAAFRAVDHVITNFHLPRSSLLVLVAAFAGRELILGAYHEAIARRYRFYSFGDAMLIL